ncbi:hypothetical protein HanPSC8_Chr13g0548131 [Helianthus annuus]|nr:hypothetical protein HanPSC8_Chr13g0548131 [Helianthus annuus]
MQQSKKLDGEVGDFLLCARKLGPGAVFLVGSPFTLASRWASQEHTRWASQEHTGGSYTLQTILISFQ